MENLYNYIVAELWGYLNQLTVCLCTYNVSVFVEVVT